MRKTEFPIVHEMIDEAYKKGREDAERDFQNSDYWNDYLADVIKKAKIDAIEECISKLDGLYSMSASSTKYPQYDHYCNGIEDCIDVLGEIKEGKE